MKLYGGNYQVIPWKVQRTTILLGCETCFLTLREKHRLRVFENRVLRRICGLLRDEVTGGWRKTA
jgi:hypothetical protein